MSHLKKKLEMNQQSETVPCGSLKAPIIQQVARDVAKEEDKYLDKSNT